VATILIKNYKVEVEDGKLVHGPLMVSAIGLAVGAKTGRKWRGLRPIDTYDQRYWIVRWADVTGYDISQPGGTMFVGSTVNSNQVILTLKTATNQYSYTLKHTDPTRVRNLLGEYLAKVDARHAP
jgi:hypothetical protein